MKRVLITGGAGFIGSHLADELLAQGYSVRVLDSLIEQVHGPGQARLVDGVSRYLNGEPPTGGAGFVGTNLADRLARDGETVRIFDDLSRPGVEAKLEWLLATHGDRIEPVVGDIRDAEAVGQAVEETSAVFHFAAQVATYGLPATVFRMSCIYGPHGYYVSDTSRFGRATGWRPTTPVAEGVARLYQWLADEVAGPVPAAFEGTGLSRPSAAVAIEGGAA